MYNVCLGYLFQQQASFAYLFNKVSIGNDVPGAKLILCLVNYPDFYHCLSNVYMT